MGLGFDLWRSTTTLGLGFEEDKVVVWFGFWFVEEHSCFAIWVYVMVDLIVALVKV